MPTWLPKKRLWVTMVPGPPRGPRGGSGFGMPAPRYPRIPGAIGSVQRARAEARGPLVVIFCRGYDPDLYAGLAAVYGNHMEAGLEESAAELGEEDPETEAEVHGVEDAPLGRAALDLHLVTPQNVVLCLEADRDVARDEVLTSAPR